MQVTLDVKFRTIHVLLLIGNQKTCKPPTLTYIHAVERTVLPDVPSMQTLKPTDRFRNLGLTRLRGQPESFTRGVEDAQISTSIFI